MTDLMLDSYTIETWLEIARRCTPWCADYVRKRYGREMLEKGIVFGPHWKGKGKTRRRVVWGYEFKIREFFSKKMKLSKKVENTRS